jgi:type VII secretion-associated serine protease mycosin
VAPEAAPEASTASKSSTRHALRIAVTCGLSIPLILIGLAGPPAGHADEIRHRQWHLDFLDVTKAHQITRGEGVTVAVLDSGVDYRHPDLQGALAPGHNYSEGRRDGWEDATGHGTAMAALIAARGHGHERGVLGIAPAATILPVRVTGARGSSSPRALEQGIEWAADHGADIASISLTDVENPMVRQAVEYAQSKGMVVIAGAGNTANGDREVRWPARYPGVIAVSGTNQEGSFAESSVHGPEVALSAPADGIVTAGSNRVGRYSVSNGTSNAAAIVAGVAALVKARYPGVDAANLINRLIMTADDRGPAGRDPRYGFGIVNPVAALTVDVPGVRSNPLAERVTSGSSPNATGTPEASTVPPGSWSLIGVAGAVVGCLTLVALMALVRRRRP